MKNYRLIFLIVPILIWSSSTLAINLDSMLDGKSTSKDPKQIKAGDYFDAVNNRVSKRKYGLRGGNLFQLSLGSAYGSDDVDVLGADLRLYPQYTLKYILINSYQFKEKKKIYHYEWENCANSINSLFRMLNDDFMVKEQLDVLEEQGRLRFKNSLEKSYNSKAQKQRFSTAVFNVKKSCKKGLYSSVSSFIKDTNKKMAEIYEPRKDAHLKQVKALKVKKEEWKKEWDLKVKSVEKEIEKSIVAIKQKYPEIFEPVADKKMELKSVSVAVKEQKKIEKIKAGSEKCYLLPGNNSSVNPQQLADYAIPLVSKFIESVYPVPFMGVNDKDCVYKLDLIETREKVSVSFRGRKAASVADSVKPGRNGMEQSILRAIYKATDKKVELCSEYPKFLTETCGGNTLLTALNYPETALLKVLNAFKYIPGKSTLGQLSSDSKYRRLKKHWSFYGPEKRRYVADSGEIIASHQQGHSLSFSDKNRMPLKSIHLYSWPKALPKEFVQAGFKKEGSLEDYAKLFKKLKLGSVSIQQNIIKGYRRTGRKIIIVAKSQYSPHLKVEARFKANWKKLDLSERNLKENEKVPFGYEGLKLVEIVIGRAN